MGIVDEFLSGRKFVRESLDQMKAHSRSLAADIIKSEGLPAQIIYIERGGMVIGRLLSDALLVKNVSGVRASYYTGINRRRSSVLMGSLPRIEKGSGYVLLVDDVADTGKTLSKVAGSIRKRYGARVLTCTVFYKPRSVIKPDFYAKEISNDKWIIFEYEENEFRGRR